MSLAENEVAFVKRRGRVVRIWPIIGSICMVLVLGFTVWLWVSRPLLINPWYVMSSLEAGSIPDPTVTFMASLLPVVVLYCLFVLLVLIAISFVVFSNERKYLEIVRRLDDFGANHERKGE